MTAPSLVVARKELIDHLRDRRSLTSSALYSLMGPFVGLMVSASKADSAQRGGPLMLVSMMSVFTLVAAFVGGMNVAMDSTAGERERRSLLPLLLTPVARFDVVVGKWMAVTLFATGALGLNILGCAIVLGLRSTKTVFAYAEPLLLWILLGLVPLTAFAAAWEVLLAGRCRSSKEAHTWLSITVLTPMLIGMFLVFYPDWMGKWWFLVPVVGQQAQITRVLHGDSVSIAQGFVLAVVTVACSIPALLSAARRWSHGDLLAAS